MIGKNANIKPTDCKFLKVLFWRYLLLIFILVIFSITKINPEINSITSDNAKIRRYVTPIPKKWSVSPKTFTIKIWGHVKTKNKTKYIQPLIERKLNQYLFLNLSNHIKQ